MIRASAIGVPGAKFGASSAARRMTAAPITAATYRRMRMTVQVYTKGGTASDFEERFLRLSQ